MADSLNAATKYVATNRPDSLEWGPAEDLGADIVEGLRRIKSKDGADLIVWGSSTLTPVLLGHGLVDEVLLLVYPELLGTCKRVFSDRSAPLELLPSRLSERTPTCATTQPYDPRPKENRYDQPRPLPVV